MVMAKTTYLGPYRLRPRGKYDDTASYRFLDVVSYDGGSYMCRNLDTIDSTSCIGVAPKGESNSEAYWQCLAERGEPGLIRVEYLPITELKGNVWDFDVTDKIYVPEYFTQKLEIVNVEEGECGVIITRNRSLQLPDNSNYSVDFNYITANLATQYYVYTFIYAKVGGYDTFLWNRTVMQG